MQKYLTIAKDYCDQNINALQNKDVVDKIITNTGGKEGDQWCAHFVMYCLNQDGKVFDWLNASTRAMMKLADAKHLFLDISTECKPEVGDIVIWRDKVNGYFTDGGHTGFVWQVNNDGTMITLEGNTSPAHPEKMLQHISLGETNGGYCAVKVRHQKKIEVDKGFELAGFIRF